MFVLDSFIFYLCDSHHMSSMAFNVYNVSGMLYN